MASRLDDRPDRDLDDKIQDHYDQRFDEVGSTEHDGDELDLYEQENNPKTDSDPDDLADEELPKEDGEFEYSSEPIKKRVSFRGRKKELAIGAGLIGIIASVVGTLFVFLPSLKVSHILHNLEERFYGLAYTAIETRAEHLLSRYMRNQVFPSVSSPCGRVVSKDCVDFRPGAGVANNLFRTWYDARIEQKLFTEQGIAIEHRGGNNYSIITRSGSSVDVDGTSFEFESLRRRNDVSAREVRRALRESLRNETHWYQLMYRRGIRNLASRKYNIRWCVFACETRDNLREGRISAFERLKLKIIERTISPFSDRLAVYFTCAVKDCSNREFLTERSRAINKAVEELGQEAVDDIISEFKSNDGHTNRRLSQIFVDKIVSKIFGTAAGRGAAAAVPVVGWLYLIDAVNQIDTLLYNGVISQFLADNTAAQYAEFYLTYKTNYDEGIDGRLTLEEVGAQSQLLNGMEQSLVYQRDLGSGRNDAVGFNLFTPAYAQSQEYICADGEPIPEGELVCEERKVGKLSVYDAWRQSDLANSISAAVIGGYRCGPFALGTVIDSNFCTPGSVADNVWFIDELLHTAFRALGSVLDALGSLVVSLIPDALTDWISERVGQVMQFILEIAFPWLHPGTGPGRQVFDDLYAGADVVGNEFAKGFEDPLSGAFVGLGGRRLTDEEVEENLAYLKQRRREEFSSKTFMARLFSTQESSSLVSTIAMAVPTPYGASGLAQSVASVINPVNLVAATVGSLVSPAYAQNQQFDGDPFGIHQYGYSLNDEALFIDPEELTPEACSPGGDIYEAWSSGIGEQSVEGQIVHSQTNPCMLEYITTNILGCWFTESDDCGVDGSSISSPTDDSGIVGDQSPVDGLVSHPNLGPILDNGYYAVPSAPNGEYEFWPNTPSAQRCGSRALVDLVYTVSMRWHQLHPDDRILIGDLNAPGHLSHSNGVDWDIWIESSTANGSFGTNEKAKQLGRLLADTGIVKSIFYNVTDVQNDFNTYVQQAGLSGNMSYIDGHFDHFHLRINDEFRGTDSTSCSSGTANLHPGLFRLEGFA